MFKYSTYPPLLSAWGRPSGQPVIRKEDKTVIHVVLGKRPVSFKSDDGKDITGTTLYLGYEEEGVEGMVVDKVFISTAKMPKNDIVVGAEVDVVFNRRGRVEAIRN